MGANPALKLDDFPRELRLPEGFVIDLLRMPPHSKCHIEEEVCTTDFGVLRMVISISKALSACFFTLLRFFDKQATGDQQ